MPIRRAPTSSMQSSQSRTQAQQQTTADSMQRQPRARAVSREGLTDGAGSGAGTTNPAAIISTTQQAQPTARRNLFSSNLSRRPQAPLETPTASSSAPSIPRASSTSAMIAGPGPRTVSGSASRSGSGFTPAGPSASAAVAPSSSFFTNSDGQTSQAPRPSAYSRVPLEDDNEDNEILVSDAGDLASKKAALEKELLIRSLEEANFSANGGRAGGDGDVEDDVDDKEHSARLIELYRSHARQQIDPNELKTAVQESLRRKVTSLDDDKWMYEVESDSEEC